MRALRRRFPQAKIHFAVRREFLPLVEHSPCVDRVIAVERGDGLRDLARLKSRLMADVRGDYDIVFDLHDSLRSRYFRFALGKELAVVRKPTLKKRLLVRFKKNLLRPIVPIPELYLAVGAPYGVTNDGKGLDLHLGTSWSPIAAIEGRPTVALAPGSQHATKQWPAERYAALGTLLADRLDARIVLLGSPGERDLCGEIASRIKGETINLAGRTTLLEAAAALDACDALVSNDSALAHVAAARKRPVAAIFGSTVQEFGFAPYGTRSIVVENEGLYCRPCTTIGRESCPEKHFRCMIDLEVERVYEGVAGLM